MCAEIMELSGDLGGAITVELRTENGTADCKSLYTVEPLYCGHLWAKKMSPDYRGVLI